MLRVFRFEMYVVSKISLQNVSNSWNYYHSLFIFSQDKPKYQQFIQLSMAIHTANFSHTYLANNCFQSILFQNHQKQNIIAFNVMLVLKRRYVLAYIPNKFNTFPKQLPFLQNIILIGFKT